MIFMSIIFPMILMMALGKRNQKLGAGQVRMIVLMVIIQLGLLLFDIFTKQPPSFSFSP
jgi:hypothetical protein